MPSKGRKLSDRGRRSGEQSTWLRKKIRQEELIAAGVLRKRVRQRQRSTRESEPHVDAHIQSDDPVEHGIEASQDPGPEQNQRSTRESEAHVDAHIQSDDPVEHGIEASQDPGPEQNQEMPDYAGYGGYDAEYCDLVDTRPSPVKERLPYNRYKREEENWQCARPLMLDDSQIEHQSYHNNLRQAMEFEKNLLSETVQRNSRRCPVCCAGNSLLFKEGTRMVIVITGEFCHDIDIPLMHCNRCRQFSPDGTFKFHVKPLQMDVFPSIPVKSFDLFSTPTTDKIVMYHIRLLNNLKSQIKFSPRLGIHSYASALIDIIKGNGCKIDVSSKLMAKHLNTVLHESTIIDLQLNDPSFDTCPSVGAPIECPACMGSQEYLKALLVKKTQSDGVSTDSLEPVLGGHKPLLHSVYVDGHFGVLHLKDAGKSHDHEPPISIKLISDAHVKEFEENSKSHDTRGDKPACCSDFQADAGMKKKSKYYDRTGVVGAFCRHGFCLKILNMTTGEKWCHATLLLFRIMEEKGFPINLWYDINCRYKGHVHRWAASKEEEIGQMMLCWITEVMGFPLPPKHYHMHDLPCQMQNSYTNIRFTGLGAGEPTEIAWSHFRKEGHILQYQSLPNRAVGIERLVHNWNRSKRRQSVIFLWDAYQRAEAKYMMAKDATCSLIHELREAGVTKEQIKQYESEYQTEQEIIQPKKSYQMHYVEAKMRLKYFDSCVVNCKERSILEVLLGEDGTHSKTIDRRINIEKGRMALALRNLPEGFDQDDHLIVKAEMEMMALKLRSDQKAITALFREKEMLRLLEKKSHTRRMENARIMKRRTTIGKQMDNSISNFIRLCKILATRYIFYAKRLLKGIVSTAVTAEEVAQARQYIMDCLPLEISKAYCEAVAVIKLVHPMENGVLTNKQKFVEALKQGCYPWIDKSKRTLESLGVELQRQSQMLRRAIEEKTLLIEEMRGCEALFTSEMESIEAELNETLRNIAALEEASDNLDQTTIEVENTQDGYLTGLQMKSIERKLGFNRFGSSALRRQRDETEPLAKSASICVDVFGRGLAVDTSLIVNAEEDLDMSDDDTMHEYDREGEEDKHME